MMSSYWNRLSSSFSLRFCSFLSFFAKCLALRICSDTPLESWGRFSRSFRLSLMALRLSSPSLASSSLRLEEMELLKEEDFELSKEDPELEVKSLIGPDLQVFTFRLTSGTDLPFVSLLAIFLISEPPSVFETLLLSNLVPKEVVLLFEKPLSLF